MSAVLTIAPRASVARRAQLLAVVALAVLTLIWFAGWRQGLLGLLGVGFGAALAAAAFGFTTGWRVWIQERDPKGLLAQFLAIALAMLLMLPLLHAHPELQGADGPLSISLVVGAFLFGAAMQIADGCGSGTLYKAGIGHPVSIAVLPAFVIGSFFGACQLPAWLALGAWPAFSLLQLGLVPALALQLGALALLAALVWTRRARPGSLAVRSRWSGSGIWWAALVLALLNALTLVVGGQPWGIVYGLGLWGAKLVQALGWDLSGNAFWGLPAQQAQLHASVLADNTSVTDIGLLLGALVASAWSARPAPRVTLPRRAWVASVLAGLVLGYSSRLAFGCNIGAYFSGIASGSLHGWVWFASAWCGSLLGVRLRAPLGLGGGR